jgi:hypothetical protein
MNPEPYDVIVRNGGKLSIRPLHEVPALYEKLAACKANAKGALDFSNRYGLLISVTDISMDSERFCRLVRGVRRFIALAKQEKWEKIAELIEGAQEEMGTLMVMPTLIGLSGTLIFDEAGKPQLGLRADQFYSFIFAQLIQDYTSGAQYKLCIRPGCGKYFYYGTGTRKRNTSSYCTDTCQKGHYYQMHKGQRK